MKKFINIVLECVMLTEYVIIILTIYSLIGGLGFRSFRLLLADIFLLGMCFVTYELVNTKEIKEHL